MPDPDEPTTGHDDTRSRSGHDERGAVAVAVAVLAATLFVLLAFVVDLGLAYDGSRQAQSAADSAALAAATTLSLDVFGDSPQSLSSAQAHALEVAKRYAKSNAGIADGDWPNCSDPEHLADTPDAPNTCISFDTTRARVVLPRHGSPAVIGGLVGASPIEVTATAMAQWAASPVFPCWLCVQGQNSSVGLNAQEGSVVVDSGNIRVGTSQPSTLSLTSGTVAATSGQIGYVSNGTNPPTATGGSYTPWPVAVGTTTAVAAPALPLTGPVLDAPVTSNGVCSPGIYRTVTNCFNGFAPGVYVLTGTSVFTGSGSIATQSGVTFYLTCSGDGQVKPCAQASNKYGGTLTWSREGDFHVNGPAAGYAYTIGVDPHNESAQYLVDGRQATLDHITARVYVTGALLAPGSKVLLRAEHWWWDGQWHHFDTGLLDVTGRIIVDRLYLYGDVTRLRQHGTPPSTPTPVPVRLIS